MGWNYNQISIDSIGDLKTAIETFATSCSWVVDKSSSDELYIHSAGESTSETLFYSFKTGQISGVNYYLKCCANLGFNTGLAWDNQPSKASVIGAIAVLNTGNSFVDCFGNKDCLYFVIHITGNYVQHLYIGKLDRTNVSETAQQFLFSTYTTTTLSNYNSTSNFMYMSLSGVNYCKVLRSGSSWYSGNEIIVPSEPYDYNSYHFGERGFIYVSTGKVNSLKSPYNSKIYSLEQIYVGRSPSITRNYVNGLLKNVYFTCYDGVSVLGQEVTYGSKTFKIYPSHYLSKTGSPGIAIRKV